MNTAISLSYDRTQGRERPDMWVQEDMFGHRFIEEQKPYMIVLEVLSVCEAVRRRGGRILAQVPASSNQHETIPISVAKRGPLRYLLFEDNSFDELKHDDSIAIDKKLDEWVSRLNTQYRARTRQDNVFDYLKERFHGRFHHVVQAIEILRGLEIDALVDRRWTSRFLAPRGPDLQFADIGLKFSSDRRFFGRGGEVVYLMLNRSARAKELGDLIKDKFFVTSDPMNRLISMIAPDKDTDECTGDARIGFLPLPHHISYDRIAEDWISVLNLSSLPTPQKFDPLFRLTALNLVRYFVERAGKITSETDQEETPSIEPIVLDVTGGARSDLRRRAQQSLRQIRELIECSVEDHIRNKLNRSNRWQQTLCLEDTKNKLDLAVNTIEKEFDTKVLSKDRLNSDNPEHWLSSFIGKATKRARNNISTLVEPLGKNSGFITSRRGTGTWFDASDKFLEALVMANVTDKPITIFDLLRKLYDRYGLVIGPNEAGRAFSSRSLDNASFVENMRLFERRLTGLGYVKRLSDDCAFVSNPYTT